VGIVIDSSVLIAAERGKLDLAAALGRQADETVAIAAITASELLHGVHRAAEAGQRSRRQAFVEHLLATVPVLPFDLLAARAHASLWAGLASKGLAIGAHDLLIGAIAIAGGHWVATRDQRSFPRIPGLKTVVW
jgi:tRNA(fMet)-specific endonuclease VapC